MGYVTLTFVQIMVFAILLVSINTKRLVLTCYTLSREPCKGREKAISFKNSFKWRYVKITPFILSITNPSLCIGIILENYMIAIGWVVKGEEYLF